MLPILSGPQQAETCAPTPIGIEEKGPGGQWPVCTRATGALCTFFHSKSETSGK